MSPDYLQIMALLVVAPTTTVACYHGDRHEHGTLYVVARHGRAVEHLPRLGYENTIDGPAVRWLAKQRRPRVWITDFGVGGPGGEFGVSFRQDCALVCLQAGIRVFETVQDYSNYIHKRYAREVSTREMYSTGRRLDADVPAE